MSGRMTLPLASRGVNFDFLSGLQLIEVHDPPVALPGSTVSRLWTPDARLAVADAKSTDLVTYYEYHAACRHKQTLLIYVVFRETVDALFARQQDLLRYPKWLMEHPAKQAERKFFIHRACGNPKELSKRLGTGEMWVERWLAPIDDDALFESLVYYMVGNHIGQREMYGRKP